MGTEARKDLGKIGRIFMWSIATVCTTHSNSQNKVLMAGMEGTGEGYEGGGKG